MDSDCALQIKRIMIRDCLQSWTKKGNSLQRGAGQNLIRTFCYSPGDVDFQFKKSIILDIVKYCNVSYEIVTLWHIYVILIRLYFQEWSVSFLGGWGGRLWKMITSFLFLAALNFVDSPI